MSNLSLYELANEHQRLFQESFDPETGEVNEQAMARLDALVPDINQKCINTTKWIENLELERAAIETARKELLARLKKREEALENQIIRWENYMHENMERCGITKISCPQFVISRQKNNPSVVNPETMDGNLDPAFIPEKYKEYRTSVYIDKDAIKEDLKAGVVVPGACLKQTMRLVIK
jgi:hypothetical protein